METDYATANEHVCVDRSTPTNSSCRYVIDTLVYSSFMRKAPVPTATLE